jgi:origin recognition complex subunit 1
MHHKASKKKGNEVFRIGDTVLIKTWGATYPSVGIIAALWQPRSDRQTPDTDNEDDDEDAGSLASPCASIHWFQLPSELPQIRADREHASVSAR